jgi:glycosyltransferase involved in cell wall biosynthesis
MDFVRPNDLPALLAEADVFVFASSCENMPNTLVEAMASGLPIASSNRGPMPEVLQDAGVYFDPEDARSIADAIEPLLIDPTLRDSLAHRAFELARKYSWERCAAETWAFLIETFDAARPRSRMSSRDTRSLISA